MLLNLDSFIPHYDEIVIGATLESLIYAYFNGLPFLYCQKVIPHEYDLVDDVKDLEPFRIKYEPKILKTVSTTKLSKPSKAIIWDKLFFVLNMNGYPVMPYECSSIRIEKNDNIIKAYTHHARMSKIRFNKLTIFDDMNIIGISSPVRQKKITYKVIDWMCIKKYRIHHLDYIETKDDLVKEIMFYPSKRIQQFVSDRIKDAVSISYIPEEKIDEYDYSDISVKFKAKHHMKESGITGRKMLDRKKKPYYIGFLLDITKRDIIPLSSKNVFRSGKRFTFLNNKTYQELLNEYKEIRSPLDNFMRDLQNGG